MLQMNLPPPFKEIITMFGAIAFFIYGPPTLGLMYLAVAVAVEIFVSYALYKKLKETTLKEIISKMFSKIFFYTVVIFLANGFGRLAEDILPMDNIDVLSRNIMLLLLFFFQCGTIASSFSLLGYARETALIMAVYKRYLAKSPIGEAIVESENKLEGENPTNPTPPVSQEEIALGGDEENDNGQN